MCAYVNEVLIHGVNNYWGDKMPMLAMEELAELQKSISKYEREPCASRKDNVIEEIRDVFIAVKAIMYRYGIDEEDVADKVNVKLKKEYEDSRQSKEDFFKKNRVEVRYQNMIYRTGLSLHEFSKLTQKQLLELKGVGKGSVKRLQEIQQLIKSM